MWPALAFAGLVVTLSSPRAICQNSQSRMDPSSPPPAASSGPPVIDGIAARIEDDIITESEIRDLAAFQKLVDGKSKDRAELIRELADQWIVRNEARASKFPAPSEEETSRALEQFTKQFPSDEDFASRCKNAGLTVAAVRGIVSEQLLLSRFIEFRFRPAAQVTPAEIQSYYNDEFAPQLKARGEAVPPVEDVEETIQEVLIQREISARASKWLDETRDRLKLDVLPAGGHS